MSRSRLMAAALAGVVIASLACTTTTTTSSQSPTLAPLDTATPANTQPRPTNTPAPTNTRPAPTKAPATPTAPPSAPLPAGVLFNDDFASQQASEDMGWSFDSGDSVDYKWSPNAETIVVKKKQWLGLNWPNGDYKDFGAETEAQWTGGSYAEYGLVIRLSGDQDTRSYYIFGVTTDGKYYLQKKINGKWADTDPISATPSQFVKQGKARNTLGVIAQGATLSLYINGFLVKNVNDNSLSDGYVGVFAGTGDNDSAQVAFDRLTILTTAKAKSDWGTTPTTGGVQPTAQPAAAQPPSAPPRQSGTTVSLSNTFPESCRLQMWGPADVTMDAGSGATTTKAVKPGTYGWRVFIGGRETEQESNLVVPAGGSCQVTCNGGDGLIHWGCS